MKASELRSSTNSLVMPVSLALFIRLYPRPGIDLVSELTMAHFGKKRLKGISVPNMHV